MIFDNNFDFSFRSKLQYTTVAVAIHWGYVKNINLSVGHFYTKIPIFVSKFGKFCLPVRDKKAAVSLHCDIRRFTKVRIVVSRNKSFAQFQELLAIF